MLLVGRRMYKRVLTWGFILFFVFFILFEVRLHMKVFYPKLYQPIVEKYASMYNVDPDLIYAVIRVESHFNSDAVSHQNAIGLMQITEQTGQWGAEEIGISDFTKEMLKDPNINIQIGSWYLNILDKEFNGNRKLVLAAYNGGSGNVRKWLQDFRFSRSGSQLDVIPFEETNKYVSKVMRDFRRYKQLYP